MSNSDLTPDELKQQFDEETVKKAKTFETHGVSQDEARKYLKSPEGIRYLTRITEASPNLPGDKLQERAISQITSGRELPRMETLNEPLVKIVPKGSEPSPHSPFWAKEADLDTAVREGKNLSQHFGLPVASEAQRYDVYKIASKAPTEVFVNTVAPTSELGGQVTKTGGATQYLTPNRKLYEPAELVKTVDNRLHIPLQKAPTQQHAPPSPEPHTATTNMAHGPGIAKGQGIHAAVKGAGIAGAVYGAYDGKQQIDAAIDTARSTREQWVRGGEEAVNVGARSLVTGTAAAVGAIPGVAAGALTSPVTGPAGPVVGGLATGGAAAVGAEKLYQDSRLKQLSQLAGGKLGELGYQYISKEGRLQSEVNGLKEDLQGEANPQRRAALEAKLSNASERFGTEVERNGRYFEARGGIDRSWEQTHAQYPKLDKDDVTDALGKHIDAGKRPTEAASAAYSDPVHEKYPRARPYQPPENYRALSNEALLEQHGQHSQQLVDNRRAVLALGANQDSPTRADQGWPKEMVRQRLGERIENGLNGVWKELGHVSAIRGALQERGIKPPELPAELRERSSGAKSPSPEPAKAESNPNPNPNPNSNPRDAFRAQENRDRSGDAAPLAAPSPVSAAHQRQFSLSHSSLAPGLAERGHTPEQIDRISAAAVGHAQQHAARGGIQAVYLSKDGQRVAVMQDAPPMGEYSVNTALNQSKDQHLEQAHAATTTQAREQSQEQAQTKTQPQNPSQDHTQNGSQAQAQPNPEHAAPVRSMA